jgi:hypothetical protein
MGTYRQIETFFRSKAESKENCLNKPSSVKTRIHGSKEMG